MTAIPVPTANNGKLFTTLIPEKTKACPSMILAASSITTAPINGGCTIAVKSACRRTASTARMTPTRKQIQMAGGTPLPKSLPPITAPIAVRISATSTAPYQGSPRSVGTTEA